MFATVPASSAAACTTWSATVHAIYSRYTPSEWSAHLASPPRHSCTTLVHMELEAATHHEDTRGQLKPVLGDDARVPGPIGYAAVIKYDVPQDSVKCSGYDQWGNDGPSPLRIKADFEVMNIPYPTHMFLTNVQLGEVTCYWSSALGVSIFLHTYRQIAYCRHPLHRSARRSSR